MSFADKLNFLMTITKTSNSALAGRVSLDASYISRLRNGKRLMPKDAGVIHSMAANFARRCSEDYQKKAISDALKLTSLPDDNAALAEEIADWLLHDNSGGAERVGRFLSGLSGLGGRPAPARPQEDCILPFPHGDVSFYYGIEGKRRTAEYFLSEVAARENPQTLLLFSDEETSWMTADPEYARKWAELMARVLSKGNEIKIIHTISRDLDEMLSAISQWMPLYMSGNIEPYFYPKKRDGVFKKTLFIAPETAAVVSNSIGDQISLAANVLYRDPAVVASFTEEFLQYLRLCRPLMRIFTARDRDTFYDTLAEFEGERADTLIKTESLSILTMPENLLASIIRRSGIDASNHLSVHSARRRRFLESLETNHFTELIHLPDTVAVKNGGAKVAMSNILDGGTVFYTPEEYAAHMEQVITLLASCENYHVILIGRQKEDRYTVYAREEVGVIVAKTSQPPVVLAMGEGNMVAAFWDFLKGMAGEKTYANPDNKTAIASLHTYLKKLGDEI
ncbi:MAG: transcriptional regulator [Syntrophomonadaceae bacterium]|nr:transcriptional regulator [Syntrophomonadaceae bacterium]